MHMTSMEITRANKHALSIKNKLQKNNNNKVIN